MPARKTPLDKAIAKIHELGEMIPPSWLFAYQPQLQRIRDLRVLLLAERDRQAGLAASKALKTRKQKS
jgi:hypothetical protein